MARRSRPPAIARTTLIWSRRDYVWRHSLLIYTVLLALATLLPVVTRMSGLIYLCAALILDANFLAHALRLKASKSDAQAMRTFRFSVQNLMWLFAALLADHYLGFAR